MKKSKKTILKKIFALVAAVCMLLSLAACGDSEPVKYSVDEMNFTVSDDFILEEDTKAALQMEIDAGVFANMNDAKDATSDIKYFYGEDFDICVMSSEVDYEDGELKKCIEETYGDSSMDKDVKEVTIDGVPAQTGYYVLQGCENHYIYILKDGMFYSVEATGTEGEYPENLLEDICKTITFGSADSE